MRLIEEMKEEDSSSLMRVEPEKDSGDLVMLVQAHRLLLKEATQSMGNFKRPTFRKHRNDMVMRQLKIVHESSLVDERRQYQNETENGRLLNEA